jgi:hypothetical protein
LWQPFSIANMRTFSSGSNSGIKSNQYTAVNKNWIEQGTPVAWYCFLADMDLSSRPDVNDKTFFEGANNPPGMRCEPLCCITEHGHPLRHQTKVADGGHTAALTAFLSEEP